MPINVYTVPFIFQSQSLSVRAYFSNIVACDIKTGRALIMFMRDSDFQPIAIRANGIFKFLLNFQLFLSVNLWINCYSFTLIFNFFHLNWQILRTTYSYVSMSMAMRRHWWRSNHSPQVKCNWMNCYIFII